MSSSRLNFKTTSQFDKSPSKSDQFKDPAYNFQAMKKFARYFKGSAFTLEENLFEYKNIVTEIKIEYKKYIDKVYGLKNLEKSFPDFFTEEF